MKKAKFILSAIGLISVVSGALAFKVQHRFLGRFKCSTTISTICITAYSTTGTPTTTLYCTLTNATTCSVPLGVTINS